MSSTNRCAVLSVVIVLTAGLASAQEATRPVPASQPATDRPATPVTTQKASTPTTQPIKPVKLKKLILDLGKGAKMEMVLIPAGNFMMGSPENENPRQRIEGPQHLVTFAKPFYMGIYPVTQEQFQVIMGKNPSFFKEESSQPVDSVTWNDCQEFCKKVSAKTQRKVRLPSEAEWEYACRAGTTTRYYWGDDPNYEQATEYAWYCINSNKKSHPVGLKKPNNWGLYDMQGNIDQVCQDWYYAYYTQDVNYTHCYPDREDAPLAFDGSPRERPTGINFGEYRVIRGGGGAGASVHALRSAERRGENFAGGDNGRGFRVVVEAKGE